MKASRFIYDNRYRIFKTLLAYATYFCIFGSVTLLGSSLLDLQTRVNADFATASYAIPVRSAGHIIGSALAGATGSRFSQSFLLTVTNLASGLFLASALFFTNFMYLAVFLFLAGVSHGIADISCNTLLAAIWKEKCSNWLQVLHMAGGVGSLITPVICRPFLLPTTDEDTGLVQTNSTTNSSSGDPVIIPTFTSDDVMVQYAFVIIGVCAVILSIPFGCIYLKERNAFKSVETKKEENVQQLYSPLKVYTGVVIVAIIHHFVYGVETVVGSLGPSFAVKSDLHMEKKTAVLLTTVFWSCFSFYKLIYIPMTFVVSEVKLLLFNCTLTFIGILIVVPWANYYTYCIWVGFILIGIGISPIFSAAYGMLAKHIIMTSQISSMIFIPGALGESIHPGIAATLMAKKTVTLLWYAGVLGVVFIIFYLILIVYCAKVFTKPLSLQHREVAERSSIRSMRRY